MRERRVLPIFHLRVAECPKDQTRPCKQIAACEEYVITESCARILHAKQRIDHRCYLLSSYYICFFGRFSLVAIRRASIQKGLCLFFDKEDAEIKSAGIYQRRSLWYQSKIIKLLSDIKVTSKKLILLFSAISTVNCKRGWKELKVSRVWLKKEGEIAKIYMYYYISIII